jgi:predicted transcriptional regulator
MKEEIVTIRMDADLKKELQKLADKDQRNLSDYLRLQLKKLVETSKKK